MWNLSTLRIVAVASPALTVAPSPTVKRSVKVTKALTPTKLVRGLAKVIEVLPMPFGAIALFPALPATLTAVN